MKVTVVEHHGLEGAGLLERIMIESGFETRYTVDARERNIPKANLLVFMGGPYSVDGTQPWTEYELEAIRDHIDNDGHYIGIGLGAQLLAVALGGEVMPGKKTVGNAEVTLTKAAKEDPVFKGLGGRLNVMQWNGDRITRLPLGAGVMAEQNDTIQAFRAGKAIGLQFHLELTQRMLLSLVAEKSDYVREAGREPTEIRSEFAGNSEAYQGAAYSLFRNFMREMKNERQ